MRVITRRDVIRGVPKRWERQYRDWQRDQRKQESTKKLRALDTEICDREAIDQIIGNDTWTAIMCAECGADVEAAVVFEDLEEETTVCGPCLSRALGMLP